MILIEHLHTDNFSYSSKTKTFLAEASDLGLAPGCVPSEIALTSGRTNVVKSFWLDHIAEDGSLKFLPCGKELRDLGVSMIIIND
jgi:hypothetical protein